MALKFDQVYVEQLALNNVTAFKVELNDTPELISKYLHGTTRGAFTQVLVEGPPLHWAAYYNRMDACKYLIELGADAGVLGKLGWQDKTAVNVAHDWGYYDIEDFLQAEKLKSDEIKRQMAMATAAATAAAVTDDMVYVQVAPQIVSVQPVVQTMVQPVVQTMVQPMQSTQVVPVQPVISAVVQQQFAIQPPQFQVQYATTPYYSMPATPAYVQPYQQQMQTGFYQQDQQTYYQQQNFSPYATSPTDYYPNSYLQQNSPIGTAIASSPMSTSPVSSPTSSNVYGGGYTISPEVERVVEANNPVRDNWTPEHTCCFISSMPMFKKYAPTFLSESITGSVLVELSDGELQNVFQMKLGERKEFLKILAKLKGSS